MPITPGQRIGPYEILDLLGKGGMGEVYRTRDTRLKRDLAIKILPDDVARDPERIQRFQREAELLASLNHPNVAHLYGFEESGELHCIVMELVEGVTLEERIQHGPLPLAEVLGIAKQVAEALEYAHDHGVIHRDLKPANIKITSDGQVKILDFGLAKAMEPRSKVPQSTLSNSPTLGIGETGAGFVLGTAAYMSPEQAKGRPVDRRADIWAFGVVLYEMLTGRTMFAGETAPETMAFVMTREPEWKTLPNSTPQRLRDLLRRCLMKDPRTRLQAIGDARVTLEEILSHPDLEVTFETSPRIRAPKIGWILAGLFAVTTAVLLWAPWRSLPALSTPLLRFETSLGAEAVLNGPMAFSPDGRFVAFRGGTGGGANLYLRRLDQLEASAIANTATARNPFFSPDSRWIGFFAEGKLKKVGTTGAVPVTIADAPDDRGGAWLEDGTIVFAPRGNAGLSRVSDNGGAVTALTALADGEVTHRWPQGLPGGKGVVFTASGSPSAFKDAKVVMQPLPQGERKIVVTGGFFGRYLSSGHLLYISDSTLFAMPFDPASPDVAASPSPVVTGVNNSLTNGTAQFAFSSGGALLYAAENLAANDVQMMWLTADGKTEPLRSELANYRDPHFSPDGKTVAVQIVDARSDDMWVYDWSRDVMSRLTFDPSPDNDATWTPDGQRVTFASTRAGGSVANLYWVRADGTSEAERLTDSRFPQVPMSWHPSGKYLSFLEIHQETRSDIMILPMEGDPAKGLKPGTPTPFAAGPFSESESAFSPDGRWLAYQSDESGQNEIYVRPFPGPGGKWQISSGGGSFATWSRDGKELFFRTRAPDLKLMVVSVNGQGNSFASGKPAVWSETSPADRGPNVRDFDLHPDGKRALILKAPDASRTDPNRVIFISNFFQELRRLNRGR